MEPLSLQKKHAGPERCGAMLTRTAQGEIGESNVVSARPLHR